jgi:hypothetical protein
MQYVSLILVLVQGFALSAMVTGLAIYFLKHDRSPRNLRTTGALSLILILVSVVRMRPGTLLPPAHETVTAGLFLAGALVGAFTATHYILRER